VSADNWAVCPTCLASAKAELEELARQIADGYGVLPIEEWDELRTRHAEGIDERELTTFREDYEIYGAEDGVVYVSYSGHCQKCPAGLDFKFAREIPK